MADKDPRVIGARIARRRHQLDWSQIELARRLGVSPSTVANWERGASYPKKKLGKVEQVLGVTLEDEPQPERPTVSPTLLAVIRQEYPDPADQQRVIEALERTMRGDPPPSAQAEEDESNGGRRAAS